MWKPSLVDVHMHIILSSFMIRRQVGMCVVFYMFINEAPGGERSRAELTRKAFPSHLCRQDSIKYWEHLSFTYRSSFTWTSEPTTWLYSHRSWYTSDALFFRIRPFLPCWRPNPLDPVSPLLILSSFHLAGESRITPSDLRTITVSLKS